VIAKGKPMVEALEAAPCAISSVSRRRKKKYFYFKIN
jgi:hypothetical protein